MDETIPYYFKAIYFVVRKHQSASHAHKETAFDLGKR